jgi:hypothetical protein
LKLVTAGVFDRHPNLNLKIHIAEGGATWVPFVGDRMNEAYRQHGMFVRPQLARLPKEYLYSNHLRQLPARRDRSGGNVGDGLPQYSLGQ